MSGKQVKKMKRVLKRQASRFAFKTLDELLKQKIHHTFKNCMACN